jgi:hypothetical protein
MQDKFNHLPSVKTTLNGLSLDTSRVWRTLCLPVKHVTMAFIGRGEMLKV